MSKDIRNEQNFSNSNQPKIEIQIINKKPQINSSLKEIKFFPKEKNQRSKKLKKSKKAVIKKGQWSSQEDKLLEQWVKEKGPKNWEACGRFIQGRKGKQCREHWNNCLNPELKKGHWGPEEDFLIMFFYEKCKGSWKKIIPLFEGRIENSVKNRFYSQLRKYASKKMDSKQRKALIAKLKLHELKDYLNEALTQAKIDLMEKTKMTQEQFVLFLNQNEQKIKTNDSDLDIENNEANLSTNLGGSQCDEESSKNSFMRKRKREEDENDKKEKDFSLEKFDFSSDKENSEGIFEEKEMNLEENNYDIFNHNISSNNEHGIVNNNYIKDNCYMDIIPLNGIENNQDEFSVGCYESYKNSSLMNVFKDNNFEMNFDNNNYGINTYNVFDKNYYEIAFNYNSLKEE